MISLLLLGLALRVGANTTANPHPTYTVSGAGAPIADGVYRPPPPAVCDGYTLNGAAVAVANGCYIKVAVDTFRHTTNVSLELYRDGEGKWVVGFGSGVDRGKPIYISNCASSILPPACHGWQVVATGQPANQKGQSDFSFSSSTAFPLGYCPPVPPPAAKPRFIWRSLR